MVTHQRRIDDSFDPWAAARYRSGPGTGSLFLATLLGVGIGLLAAPQAGEKTRRQLRKRLVSLSQEVGGGLEGVQQVSSKAGRGARRRLERLRDNAEVGDRWERAKTRIRDFGEEEDSSPMGSILALAAGVAATYFLTSDRAAPVRSRVQGAASDVRRRATDQWDRFQRGGIRRSETRSETGSSATQSGDTPQAG